LHAGFVLRILTFVISTEPQRPARKQSTTAAMMPKASALISSLLLLLPLAMQASAIEHPGILDKDAQCSSCHANKTRGKSVHSAGEVSCTVCHLTETKGDMTMLNLLLSKEKICSACHEKGAQLRQHSPAAKQQCVDCHDPHSSSRNSLLLEQASAR